LDFVFSLMCLGTYGCGDSKELQALKAKLPEFKKKVARALANPPPKRVNAKRCPDAKLEPAPTNNE